MQVEVALSSAIPNTERQHMDRQHNAMNVGNQDKH
jgi:hypothetical protein